MPMTVPPPLMTSCMFLPFPQPISATKPSFGWFATNFSIAGHERYRVPCHCFATTSYTFCTYSRSTSGILVTAVARALPSSFFVSTETSSSPSFSFFNKPSGTGKHSLCVFGFVFLIFFVSSFSFRRASAISNSRCFLAKVSNFLASFAFFLSNRSRAILALSVSTFTTSFFVASYAAFLFSLYCALHLSVSIVLLFTASSSQSLFRNVNEILPTSARTGNTACSYTSPLSPSKTKAEFFSHTTRHASPSNVFVTSCQFSSFTALLLSLVLLLSSKPGCHAIPFPKIHVSSATKLTVQNGLLKCGLSTCGGSHCPLR